MRLVPLISVDKRKFYEQLVTSGAEGIMLKDLNASYVPDGRPKSMYKVKRFEEVDAFVTGFQEGYEDQGWRGLIGALEFSCFTESGAKHMVAVCANLSLEERLSVSHCAKCHNLGLGSTLLRVSVINDAGHNRVTNIECHVHGAYPGAVLDPTWYNRVAEVRGQEWTPRVFRMKHANIERWRTSGVDGKNPEDCKINFKAIQARWEAKSEDD